MKKLILLVLIPVAFVGCFGCHQADSRWQKLPMLIEDPHSLYIPTRIFQKTIDDYNEMIGFKAVELVNNASVKIEAVLSFEEKRDIDSTTAIKMGEADWNLDGNGVINSGTIKLIEGWDDKTMEKILAHEITHMLGHFNHSESGLMAPIAKLEGQSLDEIMKKDDDLKAWFSEVYPEYSFTGFQSR